MTAMPEFSGYFLYPGTPDERLVIPDTSCKLKLKYFNTKLMQDAEKSNNNLHIWELAEILKSIGENSPVDYKVLVPEEISKLYTLRDRTNNKPTELPYGATQILENANVIVGLNGPMAHIYLDDIKKLGEFAELCKLALQGYYPDEALRYWQMDELDYLDFKENTVRRMKNSIDKILVRQSDRYCIFNGLNDDGSIRCDATDPLGSEEYINAWFRINSLNSADRSGDIILLMKDKFTDPINERYTTASACKSWHGSLNPSDSLVPMIVAYPGGNLHIINDVLKENEVCEEDYSGCQGNWKLFDITKKFILDQFD